MRRAAAIHADSPCPILMKLPFFTCLPVIAALFFLSFAPMALAREKTPEIRHIVVTSGEGSLLLSASIHGAFSERLVDELAHGSELTFIFIVELVRQRSGWIDESLCQASLTHVLRYDQEHETYIFTPQNDPARVRRTASLQEAVQWMSTFSGLPVISLSNLVADAPYAIHMQVVLEPGLLPPGIGRFVPIRKLGGLRTDRRTIEFRY